MLEGIVKVKSAVNSVPLVTVIDNICIFPAEGDDTVAVVPVNEVTLAAGMYAASAPLAAPDVHEVKSKAFVETFETATYK